MAERNSNSNDRENGVGMDSLVTGITSEIDYRFTPKGPQIKAALAGNHVIIRGRFSDSHT